MNIEETDRSYQKMRRTAGILGIVYVLLFFAGNFPTGVGDAFFGIHPPVDVVAWAAQHESALRVAGFVDLLNELLFVAFVVLLVVLSDARSPTAVLAYLGVGVSTGLWAVILGLQGAVPELARLPETSPAAQAAVVLQTTIEFTIRPLPYALSLAAVGYLVSRTRSRSWGALPPAFGVGLMLLAAAFAVFFPLQRVSDVSHALETASSIGLLFWILAASVLLLVRSGRQAEARTGQLPFPPMAVAARPR